MATAERVRIARITTTRRQNPAQKVCVSVGLMSQRERGVDIPGGPRGAPGISGRSSFLLNSHGHQSFSVDIHSSVQFHALISRRL